MGLEANSVPKVLIGLKNVTKCKIACLLMADWLIYVKLSVGVNRVKRK